MESTCCKSEMSGNQCLTCGGCGKCGGYCKGGHDGIPSKVTSDVGHASLVRDLYNLLNEAEDYEFHDFRNEKYPAPKVELVRRLMIITEAAKDGKYDNAI